MKTIKYLSDLTELSTKELEQAYKKYEPAINMTNFTNLNFRIWALIIGVIGFFYFTEKKLWDYQTAFLFLIIVSTYYLWDKLSYKKWFIEWYEAWYADWVKECIKFERKLSDTEFTTMEDMDNSSKYWA